VKDSSKWVRQPMVDKMADEIVAEGKFNLGTITGYQVADKLGCEPNSSVYSKFRDWRRRRQSEAGTATVEIPPEAEAEFRAILDRLTAEASGAFVRTVRLVGSDVDRVARRCRSRNVRRIKALAKGGSGTPRRHYHGWQTGTVAGQVSTSRRPTVRALGAA
jgi:hypothetical protein